MEATLEKSSNTVFFSARSYFQQQQQETKTVSKPLPPVTQYIIGHLLASQQYTKISLAKELQVSLITINRWAAGAIKHPTHKTFSRLLALYCMIQESLSYEQQQVAAA